ncbi:hypothetical protein IP88_13430 [alpha proteobacterium AAP81b]|nr:hypothetical protein IP88_13430 [alpha proteobacterium AAP81b]
MIRTLLAAAALTLAVPAVAQTPAADIKAGRVLKDESGARIGKIDKVLADGSAKVIFDGRYVTIPGATMKLVDGDPVTSMPKRDIAKLN